MAESIVVRMYDVGFGDCFWVEVPTTDGMRRLLIDCGTKKNGRRPLEKVVARLLDDARRDDGPHFDVIVMTHRHQDHISGFSEAGWRAVTPREVWFPWTEKPGDPNAVALRARLEARVRALESIGASAAGEDERFLLENAQLNEDAMEGLRGLARRSDRGTPRYLEAKARGLTRLKSSALPGVDVFVLGPGRDETALTDADPPREENYAQSLPAADPGAPGAIREGPFAGRWGLPLNDPAIAEPLSQQDRSEIERAVRPDFLGDLARLDAEINNTSLILVIRVGRTHLLFPGDAQWGPWAAAMGDDDRRALLKQTGFYKVGHHGSENATPRSFGDTLWPKGTVGMISFEKFGSWRIPEEHLHAALRAERFIGTSRDTRAGTAFQLHPDGWYLKTEIPVQR